MSETAPPGVYVYQPHPVSRADGLLWSVSGLPDGMTREQARALATAANAILNTPAYDDSHQAITDAKSYLAGHWTHKEKRGPVIVASLLEYITVILTFATMSSSQKDDHAG